ncbi:hypothetical protein CWB99_01160 [Pseudoalteromonas rubra]|uniref:DUF4488 domain-containing protein n=1 Tax=Pseudoalteromonas rubra TaxID=43658 RepID=A0A5S3WTH1_9GAMM|nr:hypothetical protein [Pseudoalteromonas rubra]TMP28068.1 hypothetical protein CWC00_21885 [Pseudoalteromonas rubra]TMP32732.1 hypothetical protein CWB99_01160 [Pseudoalteromonas rubra]
MKSLILTALLSGTAMANPLLGSWEFVEGQYATESGIVSAKAPELTSVKLITPTHHSYITQSQGKFKYAGGGTYVLKGNQFIETYEYGNVSTLLGREMAFTYKVEGELWHHELYENGKFVEREIWKKIK